MNIRRMTTSLAAGVGLVGAAGLMTLGFAGTAGADAGVTLTAPSPNHPSGETVTPGTPYDSGQTITVSVPLSVAEAAGMSVGQGIKIEECSYKGADPSTPVGNCDGETQQAGTVTVNATTGIVKTNYNIFALPDPNLGEFGTTPVCDLSDPCVLYIGTNQLLASAPHIYSNPFTVTAGDGSDDGANPGDGLPEIPLAIGLPLLAAGAFGGTVLRRRHKAKAA